MGDVDDVASRTHTRVVISIGKRKDRIYEVPGVEMEEYPGETIRTLGFASLGI